MENGLICEDAVNAPIPCSDYKVRYHCECPVVCREKMGMENGHIVTNMITVSSSRDGNLNPASARLNSHGAWTPNHNDQKQYIQVNFLKPILLTGIITQGSENSGSYVTSYKVLFSNDGDIWSPYQDFGQDKNFTGNNNSESMATNWFDHPIRAQYIRVVPLTWQGVIAMRTEFLGCYEGYPSVTTVPQPTFTQSVVTPNTPPTVSNSCIFWDIWVNEGHLTLTSGGDSEPISALQSLSERCTTPIMIDCVRASDELPYDQAGQKVKCDLWNGLQCFNADNSPLCYDYKARLGCLKNTTECLNSVGPTHPATTSTVNKRVLRCFEGLDISACPKDGCSDGLYCDGRQCVTKDKCPCLVDGQILMSGGFKERSNCETCQCIAGEINCEPKKCTPCLQGFSLVINKTTCECSCRSCPPGEFRCGNGECIPQERRCDGIIDCIDDEVGCVSTPMFTPPVYATATPTLPPKSIGTGQPTAIPPGGSTGNPLLVNGTSTTAMLVPVQCNSQWTSWINTDTPDTGDGDRESWTAAQKAAFCQNGKVSRIECMTSDGTASYSSGEIMQCTIEGGAVCLTTDNAPMPCSDFKIRYFSIPTLHPPKVSGGVPTVTQPSGRTQTTNIGSTASMQEKISTAGPGQCKRSWSSWINTDNPDSVDGDRESWTAAQKAAFCPHGKVSRIECRTIDEIASYSSGEIMQCTIEGGAVCLNNDNFPVPCSDYKIKYFCQCTGEPFRIFEFICITWPHKKSIQRVTRVCVNEFFFISLLITIKSDITIQTLVQILPPFKDKCPLVRLSSVLAIGHHGSTQIPLTVTMETGRSNWTAALKAAFCPHGKISRIECRTTDDIASYSSGEIMQCSIEGGAVCLNDDNFPFLCSDYKIKYFCECTAKPILPPPTLTEQSPRTTTIGLRPTVHTTQTHGGPSIAPCLTRWSRWINRDQPDSGGVDIEKMNAHELNKFCPEGRIKGIECVTVDGIASYNSGEMLSCSINNGLECLNDNNFPIACSDYKIRYYCDCEGIFVKAIYKRNDSLSCIVSPFPPHLSIHVTPVPVTQGPCIPEQCLPMVKPVLKEGEELQTVIDATGCCFQYIVVCKSNLCVPPILNCHAPMSLEPAIGESDCCLTYRCMCPTICPTTTKPVCKPGQDAVEIQTRCNCTSFACMTKTLVFPIPGQNTCQYKLADNTTQTYQTGQSWSDGVCTHCACLDKGGVADIGYKTIARPDFCCLDCQPNGCIVNGTIYKDGATMESSKKCYDKLCIFDAKLAMFIVSETRVQCSAYEQLTDCKANEEAYDATGCCMKCLPERNVTSSSLICQTCAPRLVAGNSNHTIGYFTIMDNMEVCKNIEPIPDLLECSGFCNSRSSYSHVMQGFTNRCNCCQATGSETRNVELTCTNGRTITKSYSVPKSCGCSACSGAK
ncbi:EDIL3-like protein [Mya arenaria]|uniref:EDIL3-like protein n=1 Tax=Mya arenaria TaxID=6604 RepID=A0ABY7DBK3_MYAAR|nr:EDIL3-like protein [Mya arenaria]